MKLKPLLFICLITILNCKSNDAFSLKKMSTSERYDYISSNLKSKNGSELGNFVYHIKLSEVDLKPYNQILFEKLETAVFPYDMYIVSELLIENGGDKSAIENTLNSKIKIWDVGNWSEKFWDLIQNNNLKIEKPQYYSSDFTIQKYNIPEFMKIKLANNELGENPLLMVDWKIVNYEKGKLIEVLNKLYIKQIDITPKSQSVSLYGKRGIDGLMRVSTN
ncbi:hypothetical protein QF023_001321 [Chryseobacterium sp. SLBN-27]|nr:hypothetical protein [Chryseobacterium sp. SLBN-27]